MNETLTEVSRRIMSVDYQHPDLDLRVSQANKSLANCQLCPRHCGVARLAGEIGECQTAGEMLVSSWNLHHGEEPPLSGTRGSGTIFFAGCSLHCAYCQNYTISQQVDGRPVSREKLVEIMLHLQSAGAHNINFVTPTHFAAQILAACVAARREGLKIPLVYNTSGYDLPETLQLFDGIIEIYLADMRYNDSRIAIEYSQAPDYPRINRAAIIEMHRQVGVLQTDSDGVAVSGLIIRHLVLPEGLSGSAGIFEFLAGEISRSTYVSLMSQYYPTHRARETAKIGRRITDKEYSEARQAMEAAGLTNGWVQDR